LSESNVQVYQIPRCHQFVACF